MFFFMNFFFHPHQLNQQLNQSLRCTYMLSEFSIWVTQMCGFSKWKIWKVTHDNIKRTLIFLSIPHFTVLSQFPAFHGTHETLPLLECFWLECVFFYHHIYFQWKNFPTYQHFAYHIHHIYVYILDMQRVHYIMSAFV